MKFLWNQFVLAIFTFSCVITALPQKTVGRIVGGTEVIDAYDSMTYFEVLLSNKDISFCGASLIAPNAIVTAAHCLIGMSRVLKIETAITGLEGNITIRRGVSYTATNVIVHEGFNSNTLENDIAVIIVEEAENALGRKPVPISIANNRAEENFPYVAAGFGMTDPNGSGSRILMQVELQDMSIEVCKEIPNDFNLDDRNVCAFSTIPGRSICRGDSGGPLYGFSANGTPVLVGISSYVSFSCNIDDNSSMTNLPSFFTNVFWYKEWLNSKIPGGLQEGLIVAEKVVPAPVIPETNDENFC